MPVITGLRPHKERDYITDDRVIIYKGIPQAKRKNRSRSDPAIVPEWMPKILNKVVKITGLSIDKIKAGDQRDREISAARTLFSYYCQQKAPNDELIFKRMSRVLKGTVGSIENYSITKKYMKAYLDLWGIKIKS